MWRPELLTVGEARCFRWTPRVGFAVALSNAFFSDRLIFVILPLLIAIPLHFVAQAMTDERRRHGLRE